MKSLNTTISALITRRDELVEPVDPEQQQQIAATSIVRQLVQQHLQDAAPDADTLARVAGLTHAFLDSLHQQIGDARGSAVDRSQDESVLARLEQDFPMAVAAVEHFLDDAQHHPSWHLRKNTVMAVFVILRQTGLWGPLEPARGMRTPADLATTETDLLPRGGKPGQKVRNRVATTDEVLLARLAARLDCGTDSLHRRAAALAIATTGAVVAEGPQVCWEHVTAPISAAPGTITLAGRHQHDPDNAWYIAPRTLDLTDWNSRALQDWRHESTLDGRPLIETWSIIYEGRKALVSDSAKISFDYHVNLTLEAADLNWLPGLTTLALAEWASAHTLVHHPAGLDAAAHVMGVDTLNCQRKLTKAAQRGYRLAR